MLSVELKHDSGILLAFCSWDLEMMSYPCVFTRGKSTYVLFYGYTVGKEGLGYVEFKQQRMMT